jgi:Tol biopolymer transport system component
LAVVDPETQYLSIVNVASGKVTTVGPAEDRMPSWAPDGAWFAYTGLRDGSRVVMRAGRDGTAPTVLALGFAPQVSADSKSVYFLQPGSDTGGLLARTEAAVGGRPVTLVVSEVVSAFALSEKSLVYSTGQGAQALIWRSGLDGTGAVRLVEPPADSVASGYANLMLSPDGKLLLFSRTGDDGYSRMEAASVAGGVPVELSSLKDDYPMGWTVDSARIVFVSGNAFQGEHTDVATVKPDGTLRRVIVPGGGQ